MLKKDYIRTLLREDENKDIKKLKDEISLINLGKKIFFKNIYETNLIGGTIKDIIISLKKDLNNINNLIKKIIENKEELKNFIKIDKNFLYLGKYKFPLKDNEKLYLENNQIYYKEFSLNPDLTLNEKYYLITNDKIEKLKEPLNNLRKSSLEKFLEKKYHNIKNKYLIKDGCIIQTEDNKEYFITNDLKEIELKAIKTNSSYIIYLTKEGYKFEKRFLPEEKTLINKEKEITDKEILDIIFKNRDNIDLNKYPVIEKYIEYFINKYNENIINNNKDYLNNMEKEIENYRKKYKDEKEIKKEYSELYKKIIKKNMVDRIAKHTTYITKNKIEQVNTKHKKDLNKLEEIQNLLKENKYIKDIELDPSIDLNKIIMLLKHMKELKINLEIPFTLKSRLLGNYNASGLYLYYGNIVIVDPKHPSSLLHEITHLIDLNRKDNKVINNKVKNFEEYRKYIIEHFKRKIDTNKIKEKSDYYLKDEEIIARLGEIYALLNNPKISIINDSLPIIKLKEEYLNNKNIYFNFDTFNEEDKKLLNQFYSLYFDFENLNILKQQNFDDIKKIQIDRYKLENKKLIKQSKQSFNHLPLLSIYNKDFENFIKNNNLEEELYEEYSEHTNYFININKLKNIKNQDFSELFIEQLKYLKMNQEIFNISNIILNSKNFFESDKIRNLYNSLKKEGKQIPATTLENVKQRRYYYVCDIRKLKEENNNINVFSEHFKYNIFASQFLLSSFLRHFIKPDYKIHQILKSYNENFKNKQELGYENEYK